MKHFEIKNIGFAGEVNMNSRTIEAYYSRYGNIDSDRDMIMPGAGAKTIKERGSEGSNLIVHLADHNLSTNSLLSKPKLWEVQDGGMFQSTISDTTKGNDILKLYRDGVINQHSFGFRTIKNTPRKDYNEINEVMIYEVSTVVLGANQETPFVGFKGLKEEELKERYLTICRAWNDGDYSDEVFPVIKAMKLQLEQEIINLYIYSKDASTLPTEEVTKPESTDNLKTALQLLLLKHF